MRNKNTESKLSAWEVTMSPNADGVSFYTGSIVVGILALWPNNSLSPTISEKIHQLKQTQKILRNYRDSIFPSIQSWVRRIRDFGQFTSLIQDCLNEIRMLDSQFTGLCTSASENGYTPYLIISPQQFFPYSLVSTIRSRIDDRLYMDNKKRIDDMLLLIHHALYCFDVHNIVMMPSNI